MKILGIDYGDVRVGLAVSDITEFLASGIGNVKITGMNNAVELVCEKIKEHGCEKIVLGLPVNMNGSQGEKAQKIRMFGDKLKECTGLEIEYVDERLTTVMAHNFMNQTGTYGKKRKEAVDTLSAQIILQNYLDSKRR
ncbi:MAG: Holliday junction resolvase RuvX [Clostridia bacterium]|nr:Holliday junction resolvase RuvX [Clostridia bacterium]